MRVERKDSARGAERAVGSRRSQQGRRKDTQEAGWVGLGIAALTNPAFLPKPTHLIALMCLQHTHIPLWGGFFWVVFFFFFNTLSIYVMNVPSVMSRGFRLEIPHTHTSKQTIKTNKTNRVLRCLLSGVGSGVLFLFTSYSGQTGARVTVTPVWTWSGSYGLDGWTIVNGWMSQGTGWMNGRW